MAIAAGRALVKEAEARVADRAVVLSSATRVLLVPAAAEQPPAANAAPSRAISAAGISEGRGAKEARVIRASARATARSAGPLRPLPRR